VSYELLVFIAMVGAFMAGCFALRLPVSVAMLAASAVGILVGAWGMPPLDMLRHLFEGSMSYVDTIMVIAFAMVFMKVVEASGMMDALSVTIIRKFHRWPVLMLIAIMAIIMFPGMITGSSTAAVLSAGSIMVPVLLMMGLDKITTAAIIAMGGLLGMIAPPVNLPAMIIGGGIDTPFVGFELPLLLMTVPVAIFSVLYLGYKQAKRMNYAEIEPRLDTALARTYGFKLYIPLLTLIVLMVANKTVPQIPDIGLPGAFLLASAVACFTGKRVSPDKVLMDAVKSALPVMGILMGVGMFIQVMTLTGVRGFIVNLCLSMPSQALVGAAALSIPLFGAVSAFGAASVLGVPFTLAMLKQNTIVTISALSLISSLGDMMPPTALAGMFAAEVTGIEKYTRVLRRALVPMLALLVWGVLAMYFSNQIAAILP
jgi:TRAP-type C4-dicarboxylate transport system permease large subunit